MNTNQITHSAIYHGVVRHRRYTTPLHAFNYHLTVFFIDLDEVDAFNALPFCSSQGFAAFSLLTKDFIQYGRHDTIKANAIEKIVSLGGEVPHRIALLCNMRYFGIKFSPVNFYYCYDKNNALTQVLAEVSNTPWNQRHYYLINTQADNTAPSPTEKAFHVSPFQTSENIDYHWQLPEPGSALKVNIDNFKHTPTEEQNQTTAAEPQKVFDATMLMNREPLTAKNLRKTLIRTPILSVKIVAGIYWEALKLAFKRAKFYSHPSKQQTGEQNA